MVRFGKHTLMDEVINGMGLLGEILYVVSVVGNNTYSKNTKMGARIHRTVALRRRIMTYTIV